MQAGARLMIYHTGDEKSAVGTATVVSVHASDPKNPQIKIKAGKPIPKPVSLAEVKSNKLFADSPLVRQGRLSVVPLTSAQYQSLAAAELDSVFGQTVGDELRNPRGRGRIQIRQNRNHITALRINLQIAVHPR